MRCSGKLVSHNSFDESISDDVATHVTQCWQLYDTRNEYFARKLQLANNNLSSCFQVQARVRPLITVSMRRHTRDSSNCVYSGFFRTSSWLLPPAIRLQIQQLVKLASDWNYNRAMIAPMIVRLRHLSLTLYRFLSNVGEYVARQFARIKKTTGNTCVPNMDNGYLLMRSFQYVLK